MFAFIAIISNAQTSPYARAYTYPLIAGDTLVNVDTAARIVTATAGYSALAISVNVTKLTGSAITGKAYVYESLDGVNFGNPTDSATYVTNPSIVSNLSTAISPTYTATATFKKVTTPNVYYLVTATSTGTVTEKVQFLYTARQYFVTK